MYILWTFRLVRQHIACLVVWDEKVNIRVEYPTFTNSTPASAINQFLSQLADEPANILTIHRDWYRMATSGHIARQATEGGQSIRLVTGFKQ